MPRTVDGEMIREVARGVAFMCLIFTASVYLPIVGFFSALFTPLPVLFYRAKLGRRAGGAVAGISAALVIVALGTPSPDAILFWELILLGFALGELIQWNLSIERTVLLACGSALGAGAVALVLAGVFSGQGIGTLVTDYVARNLKLTLTLYERMGMSAENIETISRSLDQIQYVLVRILPAMAVGGCLVVAWVCLLLARPLLQRRSLPYPDFGVLTEWKAPEPLVWAAIACGVLIMAPMRGIKMIALNGLLVLMTVYFFQGIAIVAHFFDRKRIPRPFRVAFYGLLALQQFLLLAVVGLGFFDMWANFRRLNNEGNG